MAATVGLTRMVLVCGGSVALPDGRAPVEIRDDPMTIGRDEQCSIVVRDPSVSSVHAELTATVEGLRVRDLGSRNRTFVDGHVCKEMFLRHRASITVGSTVLVFEPKQMSVETGTAEAFGGLVGSSLVMRELYRKWRKIASLEPGVLITGETGTGKELVAQALHSESPRARQPFEILDCTSIPPNLAESTLFGHERGAFTGAVDRRISPFCIAEGGTVFLDEIGQLAPDVQPKLLRVLEQKRLRSVGGTAYLPVNARVIAATRRDLEREVNAGTFPSDLFFRLAQLVVHVPPLREHAEDIPELVAHFARQCGAEEAATRISAEALVRLCTHDWPGNVRQLRNIVTRALLLANPTGPIEIEEHMAAAKRARDRLPYDAALAAFAMTYWSELYAECDGNISEMSKISRKSRPTVRDKLIPLGIHTVEEP